MGPRPVRALQGRTSATVLGSGGPRAALSWQAVCRSRLRHRRAHPGAAPTPPGFKETVGVDNSPAMLERANAFAGEGVRFEKADISTWEPTPYDVVFSNAALHWLPDHRPAARPPDPRDPAGGPDRSAGSGQRRPSVAHGGHGRRRRSAVRRSVRRRPAARSRETCSRPPKVLRRAPRRARVRRAARPAAGVRPPPRCPRRTSSNGPRGTHLTYFRARPQRRALRPLRRALSPTAR